MKKVMFGPDEIPIRRPLGFVQRPYENDPDESSVVSSSRTEGRSTPRTINDGSSSRDEPQSLVAERLSSKRKG